MVLDKRTTPIEGVGWELFAIASVVVGGTLLTGGKGSIWGTLAGAMLLSANIVIAQTTGGQFVRTILEPPAGETALRSNPRLYCLHRGLLYPIIVSEAGE